jgi:hypothetical protein
MSPNLRNQAVSHRLAATAGDHWRRISECGFETLDLVHGLACGRENMQLGVGRIVALQCLAPEFAPSTTAHEAGRGSRLTHGRILTLRLRMQTFLLPAGSPAEAKLRTFRPAFPISDYQQSAPEANAR